MKTSCTRTALLVLACTIAAGAGARGQTPVGTSFTYQGSLDNAGVLVSEHADLRFRLWDSATGGTQSGSTLEATGVDVVQGVFTVQLDFGGSAINGDARWLEIEVRVPAGSGAYTLLSPRQPVTAAPYSSFSLTAATANNTDTVDNLHASGVPAPNTLIALDGAGKFPNAVLRTGPGNGLDADLLDGQHGAFYQNAANISAGTLADGRLSGNVAFLAGTQTFTSAKTFSAAPIFSGAGVPFFVNSSVLVPNLNAQYLSGRDESFFRNANNLSAGTVPDARIAGTYSQLVYFNNTMNVFYGNGANLGSLNAGNITMGTLADARLSGNVALLNAVQTVSAAKTFSVAPSFSAAAAPFSVTSTGVVTNLNADLLDGQHGAFYQNAANLNAGSLADGRLSGNVALLNAVQTFTTDKYFTGDVYISTDNKALRFYGGGQIKKQYGSGLKIIAHDDTAGVEFLTAAGTHNMMVKNGRVGIGTVSPDATLRVETATLTPLKAIYTGTSSASAVVGTSVGGDAIGYGGYFTGGNTGVYGVVNTSGGNLYTGVNGGALGGTGQRFGVYGYASGDSGVSYGVFGTTAGAGTRWAGYFSGNVNVTGTLSKGAGAFKIDHPLDPGNKYLYHSFVESPDMMNIYNGNTTTDDAGFATIVMPDWFGALNRDFRYQLTVIDGGENDFVLARVYRKLEANTFVIKTSMPNIEVSWQITGIRQDAFANSERIPLEVDKPASERGKYLHPGAFGLPEAAGIDPVRRIDAESPTLK